MTTKLHSAVPEARIRDLHARIRATRWPDDVGDDWLRGARPGALLYLLERWAVVDVPGFGFSDRPSDDGAGPEWVAARLAEAMEMLGVNRYGAYASDIGTAIGTQIAVQHPERLTSLDLSDLPVWSASGDPALTGEGQRWVRRARQWAGREGAYDMLQATKPQTLAASLADWPAGLASWMLEKFHGWGKGDPFDRLPLSFMLENLSVYWYTNTAASSVRYYYERSHHSPGLQRVSVATGIGLFPDDIDQPPRSFAEGWYDLRQFTQFPRGGHDRLVG